MAKGVSEDGERSFEVSILSLRKIGSQQDEKALGGGPRELQYSCDADGVQRILPSCSDKSVVARYYHLPPALFVNRSIHEEVEVFWTY